MSRTVGNILIILLLFLSKSINADIRLKYSSLLPYTFNQVVLEDRIQQISGTLFCYGENFSGDFIILFEGKIEAPLKEYPFSLYFTEDFHRLKIILESEYGRKETIVIDTAMRGERYFSKEEWGWVDHFRTNGFHGTTIPVSLENDSTFAFNSTSGIPYSPEEITATLEQQIKPNIPLSARLGIIIFYGISLLLLYLLRSKRNLLIAVIILCCAAVAGIVFLPHRLEVITVKFIHEQIGTTVNFGKEIEPFGNSKRDYQYIVYTQIQTEKENRSKDIDNTVSALYYMIPGAAKQLPADMFMDGKLALFSSNIKIIKGDEGQFIHTDDTLKAWVFYE